MNLKTEYGYNDDNFVQNGNDMQELTVTITLCEYRNLVRDLLNADIIVERLREENKKLTEQNQTLSSFIVSQNPEMIQNFGNTIKSLFNKDKTQSEPAQDDTKQKEIEGEQGMNVVKLNTKKGYFEIKNVYKMCMFDLFLFAFYEDKKAKIPIADVVSFEIATEEDGE